MILLNTKKMVLAVLVCFFSLSFSFHTFAIPQDLTLKAKLDHRIELLYIIDATANASSWHNCQLMNTVYHQQVIKHFSTFVEHDAVSYYKKFIEDQIDFKILEKAFLSLPASHMPDQFITPKEWPIELGVFVQKALNFYYESSFQTFMLSQSSIIREVERSFQAVLNRQTWQETYFNWFSSSLSQISVLISPLKTSSHQGYLVPMSDMSQHYYIVLGLTAINNGFLVFAKSEELQALVLYHMSKELITAEMKFFPEELDKIDHNIQAYEKTWIELGFENSSDFIAHQMALCIYWNFLDELAQEKSSAALLNEAEEAGFFLIKCNWDILQSFLNYPELISWKAYTPLFLEKLYLMSSQNNAPKQ